MGSRGPIPKRDDQLRRPRSPSARRADTPPTGASVVPIPPAEESWHPMARDGYASLSESGQHAYFEPSDWQVARVWAEVLSRQLVGDRLSAVMVQAWAGSASELLTTEGARRRAGVELKRRTVADHDEDASIVAMDLYRQRLMQGSPSPAQPAL